MDQKLPGNNRAGILLFLLFTCLFQLPASAQQPRWVVGGGSSLAPPTGYNASELVHAMTTDDNGNLYVLAEFMGNGSITFDTITFALQSSLSNLYRSKMALLSYNCDGRIRWGKIIEGDGDMRMYGLTYDHNGSIYTGGSVAGVPGDVRYFGTDTTISGTYVSSWLLRYDTLGHLQWIRGQGENASSSLGAMGNPASRLLMQDTLIHYIKTINTSGALIMPGQLSQRGIYDFTYNRQGNLLSAVRLPLADSLLIVNIYEPCSLDPASNTLYLSVIQSSSYNGSGVARFDAARNLVSYDTFTTSGIMYGGMATGSRKGNSQYYFGYFFGTNCTFKGQTFTNQFGTGKFGFIMKMDLNNNLIWKRLINAPALTDVGLSNCYQDPSTGKLILTGLSKDIVVGNDTLHIPGSIAKIPIVVLDTNGQAQKLDYIRNSDIPGLGGGEEGLEAAFHNGNVFIGGAVKDSLWLGTGYKSHGGPSDFFAAKYGFACGCTPPVSSFTATAPNAAGLVNFTFTGSGADSVRWYFGDGSTSTALNPAHTFPPGNYTTCVTAYNACGGVQSCQAISVTCPQPNAAFTYTLSGATVNASYTGSTPVDSVRWIFAPGQTAAGNTTSHNYGTSGTYNLCVIAYKDCGRDTACQNITISCPQPTAAFSYTLSNTTVNVTYTGSTPVDSIRWTFAPGQTATGNTASHNYNAAGTYTVCAYVFRGCGRDTACQNITISCPQPNAAFTYTTTNTTVNVTYIGSTPVDSIRWTFAPGQTATGNTASHNYNTTGTYTICAYAFRGCGRDTACQNITLTCPPPEAAFSYTATGKALQFTYTGTAPVSAVLWNFGDGQSGTGMTANHTYSSEGTYSVCATGSNSCGTDSSCQSINVRTLGTDDITSVAGLLLYPNPALQSIIAERAKPGTELGLYDVTGRCLKKITLKQQREVIDVSFLTPGIYTFRVVSGAQSGSWKFVKQ